jgi:hypothetical protein
MEGLLSQRQAVSSNRIFSHCFRLIYVKVASLFIIYTPTGYASLGLNKEFWEQLIIYFPCYGMDRIKTKKLGWIQTHRQQGDLINLKY